ncbi:MAG TPA: 2Fe-2S iron-sulfur cluster-binding protein [Azospirillaceae bacterium]|nr:2Fe-2S iron-sulfur cluster-binding protein [Azospirillaceae bacterium]
MDAISLNITVNGKAYSLSVDPSMTVRELLHDELGLTGTKICCAIWVCGVCTIAIQYAGNDSLESTRTCGLKVSDVNGASLTTVEGLADGDNLHPLQQVFLEKYAFQCGYCTPGFLMEAYVLWETLKKSPVPKDQLDATISKAINNHICRCTGYVRYLDAIRAAILAQPGMTT